MKTARLGFDRPGSRLAGRGFSKGQSSRPCRGFTIVEVLATMSLMAIVLPVLSDAVCTATRSASDARRRTEAAGLAESKLMELVATGDWQNGAPLAGDFTADWPDYHWNASVQDWPQQSGLEQIDLHVTWRGRNGDRDIQVSTLVYNGANAGPGAASTSGSSGTGTGSSGSKSTGSSGTGSAGSSGGAK